MRSYFFDIDDGEELLRDDIGTLLADDDAARDAATRTVGELAKDHVVGIERHKTLTMWVRNDAGETLMLLAMSLTVLPVKPSQLQGVTE
jgi:hypothetical protein